MELCACQYRYNLMDVEEQAGTRGLECAAGKGLAVVIMEPLRGGALARNIPPAVQALWNGAPVRRTPADHALQWLWNQSGISLVLSGMSAMEQVEENLLSANRSGIGMLTMEGLALVDRVREAYRALCAVPCTSCKYCLPCPSGVDIPEVFSIYNDLLMYGDENRSQMFYSWLDDKTRADKCVECGECLEKCPQHIEIPDWLKQAHKALSQKEV